MEELVYLNENKGNGFDGFFKFFPEDFKVIEINTSGELCVHNKLCQHDVELAYDALPKKCYTMDKADAALMPNYNRGHDTQQKFERKSSAPPLPFNIDEAWCRTEMLKLLPKVTFERLDYFARDLFETMDDTKTFYIGELDGKNERRSFFQCFYVLFGHLHKINRGDIDSVVGMSKKFKFLADLVGKDNARNLIENFFIFVNSTNGNKRVLTLEGDFSHEVANKLLIYMKKEFNTASFQSGLNADGKFCVKLYRRIRYKHQEYTDTDFTEFVLHKNDSETFSAVTKLAGMLGVKEDQIAFAGIKDKKALTWQTVVVRGISKTHANYETDAQTIREQMCNKEEFEILKKNIEVNLNDIREHGFINYFGPQRIGPRLADNCADDSHAAGATMFQSTSVGRYMLRREWKNAVYQILSSQFYGDQMNFESGGANSTSLQTYTAKKYLWETGDIDGAFPMFPHQNWVEKGILKSLKNVGVKSLEISGQNSERVNLCSGVGGGGGESYETEKLNECEDYLYFDILRTVVPKFVLTMGCNAYCSIVWNKIASERIEKLGPLVVEGDFVPAYLTDTTRISSSGDVCKVHEVTSDDVTAKRFSLTDVILPTPGTSLPYPPNLTPTYAAFLSIDGLWEDRKALSIPEFNWATTGRFRQLIRKPTNFSFEWKQSCEISQASSKYLKPLKNQTDLFVPNRPGLKLSFSLPGSCYATSMLRELTKRGMRC